MRVLIVDGSWLFKRNFKAQPTLKSSSGELCGGVVGFMMSLKIVINKILPDRVVIAWDGFHSGKLRWDMYPQYKKKSNKDWTNEDRAISTNGTGSPEDMEKYEFAKQKILTQNIIEEMFVRQMEADYIEADDLIAQYVLMSEKYSDMIYIFSRDKDYLQLISDRVHVITSDSLWTFNRAEYEKKYGHVLENELLFKCFEGDDGDGITGVSGINRNTLIKYFPNIAKEKYLYKQLVDESYEAKKDKKIGKRKIYDKIIECEDILYRNAKLMNLKQPFLNSSSRQLVETVKHGTLTDERKIANAITIFKEAGLMIYVGEEYVNNFFSAFYMLMSKEQEYVNKMKI